MDAASISKLVALGLTLLVALLAYAVLTRHERHKPRRALLEGYPGGDFPHRERIGGPLLTLCAAQARLLQLYRNLPSSNPARASLLVFLEELRALMDGAYELATLESSAPTRARLERLAGEARAAADEMAESTARQLTESSPTPLAGDLELRVDILRALARDVDEV